MTEKREIIVQCNSCKERMIIPANNSVFKCHCIYCNHIFSFPQLDFVLGDNLRGDAKVIDIYYGGMGIVYICESLIDGMVEKTAFKTLRNKYFANKEILERFKREAQIWVELTVHENIVQAYYVDSFHSKPYISLEYVENNLRNYLAEKDFCLDLKECLLFAIQFCRGMNHVHKQFPDFVHRDIKPANCLLTTDNKLKIADFGLSKVFDDIPGSSEFFNDDKADNTVETQHFKTRKGKTCIGTLPYISPQQIKDFSLTSEVSDVYSFGIVLYEMIAGTLPFRGKTHSEWLNHQINSQPVKMKFYRSDVPLSVESLVLKCLEKKASERIQNFHQLEEQLNKIYEDLFHIEVLHEQEKEETSVLQDQLRALSLAELGKFKEALLYADKALAVEWDQAFHTKGKVLRMMGKYEEALKYIDKALELTPGFNWAMHEKAFILYKMKKIAALKEFHEKCLEEKQGLSKLAEDPESKAFLENYNKSLDYIKKLLQYQE